MNEGMDLDPQVLVAVQNERIAAAAIREAQLTAAVQQLTMEVMSLKDKVDSLTPEPVEEEEDASTN